MLKQSLRLLVAFSFALFTSLVWAAKAVNYTPPDFIPDQVVSDDKIVYLLSKSNKSVYRWSIATSAYLSPLTVGLVKDAVEYAPTTIEIAPGHSRLYVGYETGDIRYLTLTGTATERSFATTAMPIRELAAAGKYLIVVDGTSDYAGNRYSFNNRGIIIEQSSSYWDLVDQHIWSPADSKVYRVDSSSITATSIDQKTGRFGLSSFLFSTHSFGTNGPILSISADGRYLLTHTGTIAAPLNRNIFLGNIGDWITAGKFLPDGSIVSLKGVFYSWPSKAMLKMQDANLRVVEQREYAGEALNIYGTASKYAVLMINNNKLEIHTYAPNPDSDSDGVANASDAFPLDAAASRDVDKDGYPDAWNKNQNASSSSTGLLLDAYPKDAECFNQGQGNGKVCDYSQIVPNYLVPDQTLSDGKIVYLLSVQHKKIYRWSLDTATYLSPLKIGLDMGYSKLIPTVMTVSTDHKRIYLGYSSGEVTYIQLTGSATERSFVTMPNEMSELEAVGKYLLVYDEYTRAKRTFDLKGVQRDKFDSWQRMLVRQSVWDPVLSRLYYVEFLRASYFRYVTVNQSTGKTSDVYYSPTSKPEVGRSISVSIDGSKILVGNGDIFNSKDLTLTASLGQSVDAAKWLADGSVVRARTVNSQIIVEWFGKDFQRIDTKTYDGSILIGLFGTDKKMYLLVQNNGRLVSYTYEPKSDSDGDKVPNQQDAFPNDPAASVDTDNDGYPDNWNKGYKQSQSTTGLVLDAYPKDSACALITDGNGTVCDYAARVPAFIPDQIIGEGDIIYLLSKANSRIYRWSISAGNYINPLVVGIKEGSSILAPMSFAIVRDHQRLYLGYSTGQVNYINLDGVKENYFVKNSVGFQRLVGAGKYLLINTSEYYLSFGNLLIYNKQGIATHSEVGVYTSNNFAWDPTISKMYSFRDSVSPNDLLFRNIDQSTGQVTERGESPYHGDYVIKAPIRPSTDGSLILLGSGDLYEPSELKRVGSLGTQIDDAKWLANNLLVTIKNNNNEINLQQRDATLKIVEEINYAGIGLGIFGSDSNMVILALDNQGKVHSYSYIPSSDTDYDGVSNTVDALPLDPAASIDSDNDGYPDSWNPGKDASDSSTGLMLDAYPADSECYLPTHGDGTNCDYSVTMPNFIPDQIESDGEVIYFLSSNNNRIYRWSIAKTKFIKPWVVGIPQGFTLVAPSKMALSHIHNRMYLGYESGAIRYINLTGVKEQEFAVIDMSVDGLAAVGNYLLAQDYSGAWATHYIFDENGTITDKKDGNYYSREYAWDSINSRVYFFRSYTSPDDLLYEVIDQSNGQIIAKGETPYHGNYTISTPIRVSTDGARILIGSGDIYRSSDLTHQHALGANPVDALWTPSVLVTLESNELKLRSLIDFSQITSFAIVGTPIKIFPDGQNVVVIHSVNGAIQFSQFAIGDNDGDGLPKWWEDANGLDDDYAGDAVLDSDGDLLTNLQEYQAKTNAGVADTDGDGISDGDEVKTYLTNPLKIDTDADGLNDYVELFDHQTDPLKSDTDEDSFTDYQEVIVYNTDPKSAASIPPSITVMQESFEAASLSPLWVASTNSNANWTVDTINAFTGTNSIRSGVIGHGQQSAIVYKGLFAAGTLSFYARVEAEGCCDQLHLYVDGEWKFSVSSYSGSWTQYSVPLTSGNHEIEWRYQKDGSVAAGADAAWIDKVEFIAN